MAKYICWILLAGLVWSQDATAAVPPEYARLHAQAEKLYREKSYQLARELYTEAGRLELPPEQKRWNDFRLADTLWRAAAATQTADSTQNEQARRELEALIRDLARPEERDLVWAEVHESLGDFFWTRRNQRNWGEAWSHYQNALDWWAGATDVDTARQRYIQLVQGMAEPEKVEPYYYYGYYGNLLPLDVLGNYLEIARTDADKAQAHYLLAMTARNQGGWTQRMRVADEFQAAIDAGPKTPWLDDALFYYAQWMESNGRITYSKEGEWQQEPDFGKALEIYRRLVKDFAKGESRYFDNAQERLREITRPTVHVTVGNIFLPNSEVQFHLAWRNVKQVDLTLYPVTLAKDVTLNDRNVGASQWLEKIDLNGREKIKNWTKQVTDKGDYKPGQEMVRLEAKLPVGAYVLEAVAGKVSSRELILVTDLTLVVKTSPRQALLYLCNALDGSPVSDATIKFWQRYYDGNNWHWQNFEKKVDAQGLALFALSGQGGNSAEIFATALHGDRQTFSLGHSQGAPSIEQSWRIYVTTDRPAYRPEEEVHWKLTARRQSNSSYRTPANEVIEFEIADPRGSKVKEGKATLNSFGTAAGSLTLTAAMPLGEYRITFYDQGRKNSIGQDNLFRLEEYKLPEFKVAVRLPEENGKRKTFRLGETVRVNIEAEYHFGGPVADATVEVMIYQAPFYQLWVEPREFPWLYEEPQARFGRGRIGDQLLKRETLKTDASGRATLTFETPEGTQQDLEYRIEARVTDASRREIVGTDAVRVTRQRYYVRAKAQHHIFRPQDKVAIELRALDANRQPVAAEGIVKVTRDYWYEIWIDPSGQELKGESLKAARARFPVFPPPPPKEDKGPGWRLKFRGYEHDQILTQTVKIDTNGLAEFTFVPEREGYYRVVWNGEDVGGRAGLPTLPVQAETTVWVASGATTELGYRQGGVEIIVDRDTFRAGHTAPVMLVVPTNDRWVLFTTEGEDFHSHQLAHLTGTVKLLELPIGEREVPNVFLHAALVSDRQLYVDSKEIIVPPVKQFLQVAVTSDKPRYQPREDGTLSVTTTTFDGQPISAEVDLALVDESVFYIQSDYAGDPRQFFFGQKRSSRSQIQSSFNQKAYARLVADQEGRLSDEWTNRQEQEREEDEKRASLSSRSVRRSVNRFEMSQAGAFGGAGILADAAAAPASASLEVTTGVAQKSKTPGMALGGVARERADADGGGTAEASAVQVRSDFRSTLFWQPDVTTDAAGKATVRVKFPDSLTTWKATAHAITTGNEVGLGHTNTQTRQPLIVRLQAARFFLVGDTVTVSALINNNTTNDLEVTPRLETEGLEVRGYYQGGKLREGAPAALRVASASEARVDWAVAVHKPGRATLKVVGRAPGFADAMEKSFTVYDHGIEKLVAKSGKVRTDEVTISLQLPAQRKVESTTLAVYVSPSIAVSMLDALPYLVDFPYGCTEQTMSRFLPAALTAKTLKDLGLQPEDIMGRVFGGIDRQFVDKTQPKGKRDLEQLNTMVQQGLERLYSFQHGDGGWGWWKEGDSDHFMTAYVVWGLTIAREAQIELKANVLERGVDFLRKELVEEEARYDDQAWMLHALAAYHALTKAKEIGSFENAASTNLWTNRDKLNAYTRALFALSTHHYGQDERATTLTRNLVNGVKIDRTPDTSVIVKGGPTNEATMGTAHWGEDGFHYRWSDGGVEATAFALRALLKIDPKNELIEPIMNWLVKNRRGAQWSNTRDTAIAVLTLNDYLRQSGELSPDLEYELIVNGTSIAQKKVAGTDALAAPTRFEIERRLIKEGNEIQIVRKRGQGPIYFATEARFFSQEEPITAAGNEIFVRRDYYKLVGRPTLLKGYVYERQALLDGGEVRSGERIETIVTVECKNNYEYLVFEDLKPAGFEAVEIRSGQSLFAQEMKSGAIDRQFGTNAVDRAGEASGKSDYTGRTRWVYQELRDRKMALFVDKLPQGLWQIRYDFRAEVPGKFHALPVVGQAMYVPEIRANSAETRITVQDKALGRQGPDT